jgi:hypothetical protein
MTSFEKKMIAAMVLLVLVLAMSIHHTGTLISKAGGVKSIIVQAGKEIKDIKQQIDAE